MPSNYAVIFKRSENNRKPTYYYYVYDECGRKIRRSTGLHTKREAREFVDNLIATGKLLEKPNKDITFGKYSEPFWIYDTCPIIQDKVRRGGHYSKDLCQINRLNLKKHLLPYFAKVNLKRITPTMVNEWLLSLPEKDSISSVTANKQFNLLRAMLNQAVSDGIIENNPCNSIRLLIENGNQRGCFTEEEVQVLFSQKWENHSAYIACLLSATTGMRLGEIRALTSEQVHETFIEVNASWSDAEGRKTPKNGKNRYVPLCSDMFNLLKEIMPSTGLIFSLNGYQPFNDQLFSVPLKKMMEKCTLDYKSRNLSFHSFRHFFNTRLVANNVNLELVRATIGHADEKMTEHYLHLENKDFSSVQKVQADIIKKIG